MNVIEKQILIKDHNIHHNIVKNLTTNRIYVILTYSIDRDLPFLLYSYPVYTI